MQLSPSAVIKWAVGGERVAAAVGGRVVALAEAEAEAVVMLIGGGAAVVVYKIKKIIWQTKIRDEFKKREVEKIKSNLRYCAKELRKMRFYGVVGNFLKGADFLSTPDLSEIKTTFDLLSSLGE